MSRFRFELAQEADDPDLRAVLAATHEKAMNGG